MPVLQSRRWTFTLNNYTSSEYDALVSTLSKTLEVRIRYAIVGKEVGPSGTPHLQGYCSLSSKLSLKAIRELLSPRGHYEVARGNEEQNFTYCSKDGDFVEYGTRSKQGKRSDLDDIADMIKDGATLTEVFEAAPATYIRNYRGIAHAQALLSQDYEHDSTRGIWIWGPPGTGKSHHARKHQPLSYWLKPQNKWFDGYAGQETIILDDLDTPCLGHYLKIWADRYACSGEIKGGTVKLRHKTFIVTSNYSIESLFKDDSLMAQAIKRRFVVIHMTGLVEHLDWTKLTRSRHS